MAALALLALAAAAAAALELGLKVWRDSVAFCSAWALTAALLSMLCKVPVTFWAAVELAASLWDSEGQ